MQDLIISMLRLSAAVTLYGLEQVESSMNLTRGGQDLNQMLDRIKSTLDSVSDVLVQNIGSEKRDALKSVTEIAEDVVKKPFDGMSFATPREVMKTATDLIRQSSNVVSDWVGRVTSTDGEEPKPAAEVLS